VSLCGVSTSEGNTRVFAKQQVARRNAPSGLLRKPSGQRCLSLGGFELHLRRGGDAPVLGNARVDARELRERDERDQAVGRGQARVREVLRGGDGAGSEARTARRRAERLPSALARGRRRARVHAPQRGDRATSRTHPTARREARGGSRGRPWRPRRAKCACVRLILGRCGFISPNLACPSHFPLAFSTFRVAFGDVDRRGHTHARRRRDGARTSATAR
jgi:hypothetical protein